MQIFQKRLDERHRDKGVEKGTNLDSRDCISTEDCMSHAASGASRCEESLVRCKPHRKVVSGVLHVARKDLVSSQVQSACKEAAVDGREARPHSNS
jgi:hypothetical protein